jgi:hypothetical protein
MGVASSQPTMPITPIRLRAHRAPSIDDSLTILLVRRRDETQRQHRVSASQAKGRSVDRSTGQIGQGFKLLALDWHHLAGLAIALLGLFIGATTRQLGGVAPLAAVLAGWCSASLLLRDRCRLIRVGGGLIVGLLLAIAGGALVG